MNIHAHPHYSLFKALCIYIVALLFLFYEMGIQVSPSVMTTQLMRDLGIQAGGLGLLGSFYFYSYSLMQVPVGLMFDRLGARLLITLAVLVCALGAFFFGNTFTIFWASFGRLLMGFGSAFAFTGVLVISAFWFHPHRFALLTGVAQLFAALGAMGGAYPLAVLVHRFGWRAVIIFLGYIGLLLCVVAFLVIRDHPKEKCASDLFKTPKIMHSLKEVFSSSQNYWIALYAFAGWAPLVGFAALWGVPFLMTKFNVSTEWAASSISLIWIGVASASPLLGWFSDLMKKRIPLMIACSLLGIFGTVILIYIPGIPFWSTYIWLFIMGLASAGQILSFALIKDTNRSTILATALGYNNMAVVIGGAIFQPCIGYILQWAWRGDLFNGTPIYSKYEYEIALVVLPLCYLLCFITSTFLIRETHCQPIYLKKDPSHYGD